MKGKIMKYFYGFKDECFYHHNSLRNLLAELKINAIGMVVEEMKSAVNSDLRYCVERYDYTDDCGSACSDYAPCNRRSGKCKHSQCVISPTGATWEVVAKNKLKKLTGRK
jgi:hypothetical protein